MKNKPEIMHILGIDYGASSVGLALADTETKMAFAYGKIKNDKNLLQKLSEIIKKENAQISVIGIPSHINRKKAEYAGENLGNILEKTTKIKVFYQNEMFTTKIAQDNLIMRGIKGIKRFDDQEAARIILQEWLDKTVLTG